MANIYMYDYGDNKRKAKIRNTSMLVDLSFGAAHKKQNDHRTVPWLLIKLPKDIHRKISGHYSSIQPESNYMRVRDWLNGQSYEDQYQYGLKVLKMYGY